MNYPTTLIIAALVCSAAAAAPEQVTCDSPCDCHDAHGDDNAVANAVGYATYFSCSHDAVIRVYDVAGKVIETHEYKGEFKE